MNKEEFELSGYTTETLPSGYLNIISQTPFTHNGGTTLCRFGGRYTKSTQYKSLDELLRNIRQLVPAKSWVRATPRAPRPANENDSHGRTTLNPESPVKKKNKKTQEETTRTPDPIVDQPLTTPKPRKPRASKKSTLPDL